MAQDSSSVRNQALPTELIYVAEIVRLICLCQAIDIIGNVLFGAGLGWARLAHWRYNPFTQSVEWQWTWIETERYTVSMFRNIVFATAFTESELKIIFFERQADVQDQDLALGLPKVFRFSRMEPMHFWSMFQNGDIARILNWARRSGLFQVLNSATPLTCFSM